MSKILKNNTASDVFITDMGITILASSQLTLDSSDYERASGSDDLVTLVGNSTLTVNDGTSDLTISEGINLLKGIYPRSITINANEHSPVITHFCDPSLDDFGRLRVSTPNTLFQSSHTRGKEDIIWSEKVTGTGSSVYDQNKSCVNISVSSSGDSVTRQTKRYFQYFKGKSQLVDMTFKHNSLESNVKTELGYGDDLDGVFFGWNGTEAYVNLRSSTSGSALDNPIPQSSWNMDKLDGTGPSGKTLDLTKTQLLSIQFSWLGVNSVSWTLVIDGTPVKIHKMTFTNTGTEVYMRQAILPLRYKIEATGVPSSPMTLCCICQHVASEGELVTIGRPNVISTGSTPVYVTDIPQIVAAIRLKSSGKRFSVQPSSFSIDRIENSETLYWRVLLNPSGEASNLVWEPINDILEGASSGVTQSGGFPTDYIISEGFIPAGTGKGNTISFGSSDKIEDDIFLGCDLDGVTDILALEIRRISGNGTQGIVFVGNFREYF